MEKLTSILVVALDGADVAPVLEKARAVADRFGSRVEVLVDDSRTARAVTAWCAAQTDCHAVTLHSVSSSLEAANETILRRVWGARPDLVVKSPARDGSDLELAEDCPVPVLVVRRGPWNTPARFVAAVDVADAHGRPLVEAILRTAGSLAQGTHGHLDILYSEREARDEALRMERAVRLAQLVREFHVGCERLQIFSGDPAKRLPPLIAARQYDVLVLGAGLATPEPEPDPRRTVQALMEASGSDVVLVKAPSSQLALVAAARRPAAGGSQVNPPAG